MEEFGPELVTNEVPYSDPVFSSSVVAEGLYPADRAGQPSSSIRHFGAHPFVEKRLLLDLSLLAISGRGSSSSVSDCGGAVEREEGLVRQ